MGRRRPLEFDDRCNAPKRSVLAGLFSNSVRSFHFLPYLGLERRSFHSAPAHAFQDAKMNWVRLAEFDCINGNLPLMLIGP